MTIRPLNLLLLASAALPTVASAQAGDVVIMRRVLAPATRSMGTGASGPTTGTQTPGTSTPTPAPGTTPTPSTDPGSTPTPAPASSETYSWTVSDWSAPQPSCGTAPQTRTATCVGSVSGPAPDAKCGDGRPETTQRVAIDYSTCTYAWATDDWSPWSSTCSENAFHTRNATCIRSGGDTQPTAVDDQSLCTARKPFTRETTTVDTGCTYAWQTGDYAPAPANACGDTPVTRAVTCEATNGDTPSTIVDDSKCDGAARPTSASSVYATGGCTYTWTPTPWTPTGQCSAAVIQTRTSQCMRSGDGGAPTQVDASNCTGSAPDGRQTVADYSGCTYNWSVGSYTWSSTCSSNATETRSVACTRSGGTTTVTTVDDNYCAATSTKPATTGPGGANYSGCLWSYNAYDTTAWSSTCSSNATRTATWYCERSADGGATWIRDGAANTTDYNCSGTVPSSTQTSTQTSGCSGLVLNGGFESGKTSWSFSSATVSSAQAHTGTMSAYMAGYRYNVAQTVQVPTGTYYVSFYGYGNTFSFQMPAGWSLAPDSPGICKNSLCYPSGGWTKFKLQAPAGNSIYMAFGGWTTGDSYIDDVSISLN